MRVLLMLLTWLLLAVPVAAQGPGGPWTKITFGSDSGPTISSGTGSPENVVTAVVGSVYLRTDGSAGSTVYFKESGSGNTGWATAGSGGSGCGSSTLLDASCHTDTSAGAAVRGATIVANSTPAWARLTPTTTGQVLRFNGTDSVWSLDGSLFEDLNASEITSGSLPDARLSANVSLFGASVDSSEITNGTIVFADWASNSCSSTQIPKWNGAAWACAADEISSTVYAPSDASYWTSTSEGALSNETNLGALTTGLLKHTVTTGVSTPATAAAGTDYTTPAGSENLTNKAIGSGTSITSAPTLSDGVKWTFNPNGTNAGLNVGSHTADPSAPANGDIWYDSTGDKFRCREDGATVDCIGSGGGSPGGSSGDLQINDGAGGFDPYAGDGCSPGDFVTDIASDGSVTCDTPAGGGDVSKTGTLTANNLIIGAGTGQVSPLGSLGTTTTVLHGNAGGAPTFGAVALATDVSGVLPAANGGAGVAESHTASASASLDFTTCIASGYDVVFRLRNIIPATDNVDLRLLVSTDGGSTWASTTYAYARNFVNSAGASDGYTRAESQAQVVISDAVSNTVANGGVSGVVQLLDPLNASSYKTFLSHANYARISSQYYNLQGSYWWRTTTAVNAVRFIFSSGNIASGSIGCYRVAQ